MAGGLADGGADGLRTLAPELRPLLRDTAWFAEAARGTRPDDVSRLVRATSRVAAALDRPPERLGVAGGQPGHHGIGGPLARHPAGRLDRRAQPRAARHPAGRPVPGRRAARPGARRPARGPRAADRAAGLPRDHGRGPLDWAGSTAPGRRARTIAALETAFRDVPGLVGRLARAFPDAKPLADCLSSHVLPLFNAKVPDGALSTGRPVWQDLVHATVGPGRRVAELRRQRAHGLRYQLGMGGQSLCRLPGRGGAAGRGPGHAALATPPAARPHVPAAQQPRALLAPAATRAGHAKRRGRVPAAAGAPRDHEARRAEGAARPRGPGARDAEGSP